MFKEKQNNVDLPVAFEDYIRTEEGLRAYLDGFVSGYNIRKLNLEFDSFAYRNSLISTIPNDTNNLVKTHTLVEINITGLNDALKEVGDR